MKQPLIIINSCLFIILINLPVKGQNLENIRISTKPGMYHSYGGESYNIEEFQPWEISHVFEQMTPEGIVRNDKGVIIQITSEYQPVVRKLLKDLLKVFGLSSSSITVLNPQAGQKEKVKAFYTLGENELTHQYFPIIVYNESYFLDFDNELVSYLVLGHEIAHHFLGHRYYWPEASGDKDEFQREELMADFWSGYAIGNLGLDMVSVSSLHHTMIDQTFKGLPDFAEMGGQDGHPHPCKVERTLHCIAGFLYSQIGLNEKGDFLVNGGVNNPFDYEKISGEVTIQESSQNELCKLFSIQESRLVVIIKENSSGQISPIYIGFKDNAGSKVLGTSYLIRPDRSVVRKFVHTP